MPIIRCQTCGRTYSYEKQGMCPKCGAYNRPPRRERIDPDGSIHYLDDRSAITGAVPNHPRDKVCYEKKVCYEEQTKKPSFQDVENLVATFFPKRPARSSAEIWPLSSRYWSPHSSSSTPSTSPLVNQSRTTPPTSRSIPHTRPKPTAS